MSAFRGVSACTYSYRNTAGPACSGPGVARRPKRIVGQSTSHPAWQETACKLGDDLSARLQTATRLATQVWQQQTEKLHKWRYVSLAAYGMALLTITSLADGCAPMSLEKLPQMLHAAYLILQQNGLLGALEDEQMEMHEEPIYPIRPAPHREETGDAELADVPAALPAPAENLALVAPLQQQEEEDEDEELQENAEAVFADDGIIPDLPENLALVVPLQQQEDEDEELQENAEAVFAIEGINLAEERQDSGASAFTSAAEEAEGNVADSSHSDHANPMFEVLEENAPPLSPESHRNPMFEIEVSESDDEHSCCSPLLDQEPLSFPFDVKKETLRILSRPNLPVKYGMEPSSEDETAITNCMDGSKLCTGGKMSKSTEKLKKQAKKAKKWAKKLFSRAF